MIKTLTAAMLLMALSAGVATAAPCKDPNGKFIKCPAASAPAAKMTPAMTPAAPKAAKPARCTDGKGKFIKCGAASAPMAAAPSPAMAKAAAPASMAKPAAAPPVPMAKASPPATPAVRSTAPRLASAKLTQTMSSAGAPAGATAKCKDSSYSMAKGHSGACSRHGGVAAWLQ
jgi:hypothetical protein